ncbi:Ig-like domain-containing protein [Acidaminobacter hydrogenoformans]|uniref:Ig-like domain-containing protein n=1 Tax=Acidaminobacter hydrogenoformans DSM 2784 TaxID=1120920 RepID=A0A1G5S667_9FIRM|nr:Ig-like domain-containing protein [Acidaminobacter hydrogenoformans]SCZ81823.1 Ig-like domain-containing protein [Acidaminobacter hydrogenoformans DSM 2784]
MKKVFILASLLLALLLLPATISMASGGGGGGTGGGTGGNSTEPLTLVSSTVMDGQTEVGLTPEITMVFSKNVTDLSVKEANLTCFALEKKDGGEVGFEVIMADSQVEPEKKNDVVVRPSAELEAGTQYIVTISKALTSKSGASLAEDVTISFTTVGDGAAADAAAEAAAETATAEPVATEAPAAEAPAVEETAEAAEATEDAGQSSTGFIIAAAVAVILVAWFGIKKKRS